MLKQSKSKKTVTFTVIVDDRFGNNAVKYASLSGWRAKLARKRLIFDSAEWTADVAQKYVGMMVLKTSRNQYEGDEFLNKLGEKSRMEIHFWAYQFLTNKNASRAWRVLNND